MFDPVNPEPSLNRLYHSSKHELIDGLPNGFDTLLSIVPKMLMGNRLLLDRWVQALSGLLRDEGVKQVAKSRIRETKAILLQ